MRHFIPAMLVDLFKSKKILHGTRMLKTDNLADLLNYVISKRFFVKKRSVAISSTICQRLYGMHYNAYIDYLVSHGIFELTKGEVRKQKCRQYKLADNFWQGGIVRHDNPSVFLIKKQQARQQKANRINPISPMQALVVLDLDSVQIDHVLARQHLQGLFQTKKINKDALYRNLMSIGCIAHAEYYHSEDQYGRLHTNLTVLKRDIRDTYLHIDGEDIDCCDIPNCQPLLLARYLQDFGFDQQFPDEFARFKHAVLTDTFYTEFAGLVGVSRSKSKPLVYKVFFGKHRLDQHHHSIFNSMYPNLWQWMSDAKRVAHSYKLFSHELQKRETHLIFERIVREIKATSPHVKLFTVHDALYFKKTDRALVAPVFDRHLAQIFA